MPLAFIIKLEIAWLEYNLSPKLYFFFKVISGKYKDLKFLHLSEMWKFLMIYHYF